MAHQWTCQKCKTPNPRVKQKCANETCTGLRPKRRVPKHQLVLEVPYELWVERFGEICGICGRPPGPTRRLDRDHCHRSGRARGLLCFRCNKALDDWVDARWLEKAAAYLERHEAKQEEKVPGAAI